jgi:hypothetical protein
LGVYHFKSNYQEPERENISKIVKLVSYFPRFIDEEANEELMSEITNIELKSVVDSFQKDKSPNQMVGLSIFT